LIWDESSQKWKKRYGFNRANDPMADPIYEHKEDDFTEDIFDRMAKEKKKRVANNEKID